MPTFVALPSLVVCVVVRISVGRRVVAMSKRARSRAVESVAPDDELRMRINRAGRRPLRSPPRPGRCWAMKLGSAYFSRRLKIASSGVLSADKMFSAIFSISLARIIHEHSAQKRSGHSQVLVF
ncbi:MAG TPA: hypothetical protein VGQ36_26085 [Thermoanaerobaculia bacterium]|nr:hypothetical protein [Thermoanaerobaculia bacterium]